MDRGQADPVPRPPYDVVVVGSANLDVVLDVRAVPRPGETVLARGRTTGPGGKGANQAVAAARSGARTAFVGAVGDDDAAAVLLDALGDAGVGTSAALLSPQTATGTAYVVVDEAGENAIVVDPGANATLTGLGDAQRDLVAAAAVVLCQLEVPLGAVREALAAAGGLRVLNAAPAQPLPDDVAALLDVLVVNAQEARDVAGAASLDEAVPLLLARVPEVVVTLGPDGALVARRGEDPVAVPGVPARRVADTTGAGDAFTGAYAAARAAGADALDAARTGCAAGSLAVERAGAATAPTRDEVRERLQA